MKKLILSISIMAISYFVYPNNPTYIKRDTLNNNLIIVNTNDYLYVKTSDINIADALENDYSYKGKLYIDNMIMFYYRKNQYNRLKTLINL